MSDHDEILELIRTTHADMKDIVKTEVGSITQRLDRMNGTVAKLQEDNIKGHKMAADFRRLECEIHTFKKKWFYVLLTAVLFVAVVVFFYDLIGFRGLYELITGIK